MKNYKVGVTAPPFHYWCRSVTAPYFNDEFTEGEKRIHRNEEGKTGYVDSKMKYNEWKEKYVTNSNNSGIIRKQSKKTIKVAKTFNLYNKITANNLLDKLKIDINDYKPFGKYDPFDNNIQEQTAELLKFNYKPTILNDIEFKNAKGQEIIRVVHSYHGKTAEEAYQNTIKGKIQYSEGTNSSYGRCIYFGDKKIQYKIISDYAKKNNKIINAKIDTKAKIIEFKNQLEYSQDMQTRLKRVPENLKEFYNNEKSLLYMLDGIDGINLKWNNYYCIYNRGVLIINE